MKSKFGWCANRLCDLRFFHVFGYFKNLGFRFRAADGNVALITALMIGPMILVLGGAVDVARLTRSQAAIQSALEASVLAAASLGNPMSMEDTIADYMAVNLPPGELRDSIDIQVTDATSALNRRLVTVTASAALRPDFLQIIGMNEVVVAAQSTATQAATNVELSLVLDISSSMRGSKLQKLRVAASEFISIILSDTNIDRTSINLVPFGGSVNIGDLFDSFVIRIGSAIIDPSPRRYKVFTRVPKGNFRFSDGDKCIEYVADDFDSDLIPLRSRPQVPHFWKYRNFNPWCPQEESSVVLNSNDKDALVDRINEMLLADGTGMDIGTMWGAKALNPSWRGRFGGDFPTRPSAFNDETIKVLVLMTDGAITPQYRPIDFSFYSTHTNKRNNNPIVAGRSGGGNKRNEQKITYAGGSRSLPSQNNAVGYFLRLCDELRDDGVVVYTIGFQITPRSLPEQMLQYCATFPSNYYLVENLDIASAFRSIASSVNSLRITG